jgi:type I restriction enzyme S subunit
MPQMTLKRAVVMRAGGTPAVDDPSMWDDDGLPWVTITDMSSGLAVTRTDRSVSTAGVAAKSLPIGRPGTLLFAMYASVGTVGILGVAASWNQAILGIEARPGKADETFTRYWLEHLKPNLGALVRSTTQDNLNAEQVGNLPFPQLSLRVQRAIGDYLDRETARIDALIGAKQRLVELLEERRTELATNLLLGPPVAGEQAGPGQVTLRPGWRMVPFGRLFREIDARSETGNETLLSVSQTRGVIPQSELGDRRQYAETLVGYKLCQPGDLVVNRMWVYYGALGVAQQIGLVSPDYAVFQPIAQMSSSFAAYILRTPAYVGEMTRLVRGIGAAFQGTVRKPRLHPSELGVILMPVPAQSVQQTLLERLDQHTEALAYRASLIERSISLLRERRQSLITAAVTGQLGIPEAA